MKVLLLSSFVLAIYGLGCEDNCDTCTDEHDIATISCDVAKTGCSIANSAGYNNETETEKVDNLLGEPKIETITADECRQKCQYQAETDGTPNAPDSAKFCNFFRWEMGHEATAMKAAKPTTCSLQTTCPVSSDHCRTNFCVSGQLGCSDNCEDLTPCTLSTPTVWTHDKFHVICTDPNDVDGDVNIYSEEDIKEIANGTICNTIRKCSEWVEDVDTPTPEDSAYYLKLAVECVNGKWATRDDAGSQAGSEAMIGDGTKIEEQECPAKCLELDLENADFSNQWWADLVCDHPLEGTKLVEPNSCILLCDNHLSKTIDCKYNEDVETAQGDKIWQDSHGTKLEAEDIKC